MSAQLLTLVLGIRTQVLALMPRAFYRLAHLLPPHPTPRPHLGPWIVNLRLDCISGIGKVSSDYEETYSGTHNLWQRCAAPSSCGHSSASAGQARSLPQQPAALGIAAQELGREGAILEGHSFLVPLRFLIVVGWCLSGLLYRPCSESLDKWRFLPVAII